jgi:hypothetical protein
MQRFNTFPCPFQTALIAPHLGTLGSPTFGAIASPVSLHFCYAFASQKYRLRLKRRASPLPLYNFSLAFKILNAAQIVCSFAAINNCSFSTKSAVAIILLRKNNNYISPFYEQRRI